MYDLNEEDLSEKFRTSLMKSKTLSMTLLKTTADKLQDTTFGQSIDRNILDVGYAARFFNKVEVWTGLKPFHQLFAFCVITCGILLFGYAGNSLVAFIGLFYPLFACSQLYLSLNDCSEDAKIRWMKYWIVYSLINACEIFLFFWLPKGKLYWMTKCAVLFWCLLPDCKGAEVVYEFVVLKIWPLASVRLPIATEECTAYNLYKDTFKYELKTDIFEDNNPFKIETKEGRGDKVQTIDHQNEWEQLPLLGDFNIYPIDVIWNTD